VTDGSRRELPSLPLDGRPFLKMNARYAYVGGRVRVALDGGAIERLELGDRVRRGTVDAHGLTLLYDGPNGRTLAAWDEPNGA